MSETTATTSSEHGRFPTTTVEPASPAPNWMPPKGSRVAVAMSGGVDSSAVAHLLVEAGYEVIGLTAWTLNGPGKCCNDALVNAGRVCETLGIPFDTVDLRAEFTHYVMAYYNASYQAGLTPNPCVECNRYVKWECLVQYAVNELGVDYVATGHYCRIARDDDGHAHILRAVDPKKDQTYMMARVFQKDLNRAVFPLGSWTKPEVVAYAHSKNIPTAHSKESMDVCFVLDGQANYLKQVLGEKPGNIVEAETGKVLGQHSGYYHFTIGQRKGVNVAAGYPIYVLKTDAATNTVYVGKKELLEQFRFTVKNPHWLGSNETDVSYPVKCLVKARYSSTPSPATVSLISLTPEETLCEVSLETPVDGVTPGQIAAFYDDDFEQLLGGAFIEDHLRHPAFDMAQYADTLPDLHCEVPTVGIS